MAATNVPSQEKKTQQGDMFNQFIQEHTRTGIEYISIFVA